MGGKFFATDQYNPCSRILTEEVQPLIDDVLQKFSRFFDKMEPVTCPELTFKEDHGDIDFVCLVSGNQRDEFREFVEEMCLMHGSNGPMDHVAYPSPIHYPHEDHKMVQIDFIFAGTEDKYNTILYFYSRPTVFNSVIGQFARSLGYIFSTDGFFLLVKDARDQNRKILLTQNLETVYDILKLPEFKDEEIFSSPEAFCDWIMSSPRFDSEFFERSHNVKSHRGARRDPWCERVYEILDTSGKRTEIPVHFVDFTKGDIDIQEAMKYEIGILGEDVVKNMMEQLEKFSKVKTPVISGDALLDIGYERGPVIGKIIQAVSEKFSVEDTIEEKIAFVKENFPLS